MKGLRQNPRWVAEVSVMEGGNGLINRPNEAQAIVCWGHGSGQLFNCRQEPELRVRVDLVGFPQGIVSIDEDHCRTVAGGHLLLSAQGRKSVGEGKSVYVRVELGGR